MDFHCRAKRPDGNPPKTKLSALKRAILNEQQLCRMLVFEDSQTSTSKRIRNSQKLWQWFYNVVPLSYKLV